MVPIYYIMYINVFQGEEGAGDHDDEGIGGGTQAPGQGGDQVSQSVSQPNIDEGYFTD